MTCRRPQQPARLDCGRLSCELSSTAVFLEPLQFPATFLEPPAVLTVFCDCRMDALCVWADAGTPPVAAWPPTAACSPLTALGASHRAPVVEDKENGECYS